MTTITTKYINEKEAAQRYCYTRSWFQRARWAKTGPPFVKIGHKILYSLEEIDKWFADRGYTIEKEEKIIGLTDKELELRTDILSLIGLDTELVKKGNSYVGICPFHEEVTPSFRVDNRLKEYFCFGCGEHGGPIDYLIRKKSMAREYALAVLRFYQDEPFDKGYI